ncbi:MAG TPA: PIN domain-containing protein [Alloacidobacterium sp.]|nr:PIN domain-containing protein [Alloacidobacterium sp.]
MRITPKRTQLSEQGTLYFTHQNIAELWNVLTRPLAHNGFGLSKADAEKEVQAIEAGMTLLPDSERVYREWRRIVLDYGVSGTQVHDARLAATMIVHGIRHILTFNAADFRRYDDLIALHPDSFSS